MLRRTKPFVLLALLGLAMSTPSQSQPRPQTDPYVAASIWTLGVMTGSIEGTSLRMINDLAIALNDGPNLRIVPMIGESSIRNVSDLSYLKGVDVAVVQSDVLSHLRRTKRMPGIEDQLQYIAKLHSEEFHVLSRMKYMCLADLAGRKVNFGPAGSGSALTAQAVFEASKVQVEPQYLDQATAVEKLRKGEIDASVFVVGKPSAAFDMIRYTESVHFLDVEFVETLQRDYLPAIMTHDDYPDLIAPNETVTTIAVSAVMAVSKSPPKSERYLKLERFVDRFFSKFEQFRERPFHAKWQEVTLSAPVTGWTRFPVAQQWLKDHPDSAAAKSGSSPLQGFERGAVENSVELGKKEAGDVRELFEKFRRDNPSADRGDREKLFKDFVRWYQQSNLN
jgi:TRAP transporter TAXI family solute receptor